MESAKIGHTVYEVKFKSPNGGHWTATYRIPDVVTDQFAWAESKALRTLEDNNDKDSKIVRIEIW